MIKNLKLFKQIMYISICIFLTGFMTLVFMMTRDTHIENQDIEKNLTNEIENAINRYILTNTDSLGNLGTSHSYWTDFQDKILEEDTEWIKENATEYMIIDRSFGVDHLFFIDDRAHYKELYGSIPQSVYDKILYDTPSKSFQNGYMSYLVLWGDSLHLLTASSITDSVKNNPTGIYFLGRKIDDSIKSMLTESYEDRTELTLDLVNGNTFYYMPFNTASLKEILTRFIKVDVSKIVAIENNKKSTVRHLLTNFIVALVSVILLLLYFQYISRSLNKSIAFIKHMTFNDYSQRLDLTLSKEFSELGECINVLASGLEKRDSEINKKYVEIIAVLIKALEETDRYTRGHSERVSHYSVALARAIRYPDIEQIRLSALLHDVGKISISSAILNKPGKLTQEEFDEVKKHPMIAYKILEVSDVFNFTKDIVKCHHEKLDGTGYPDGLKGDEIPLGARIVAIADVFDSLTSNRSYRRPLPVEEALEILRKDAGNHFEPSLVAVFDAIAFEAYDTWSTIEASPNVNEFISHK